MKLKEYTIEVLHNLGNYENVKYSLTATVDKGEEPDYKALRDIIEAQHQAIYGSPKKAYTAAPKAEPAKAEEAKKWKLENDSATCKQIEERLKNKTATIEQVLKYYDVDDTILAKWKLQEIL